MQRSTERILTTHVGSLLRPVDVMQFIKRKDAREPYDEGAFDSALDVTVGNVVREQAQIGIDVVNDGEFSRTNFSRYILGRLTGFEMQPVTDAVRARIAWQDSKLSPSILRERAEFADFHKVWDPFEMRVWMPDELQAAPSPLAPPSSVPVCTGPISYSGTHEISSDLSRLRKALSDLDVAGGFVTAASPPLAAFGMRNNAYYPTQEEYLFALADALNVEYRAITDAGFVLQIDSPELTHLYDPEHVTDYLEWLDLQIEAINRSLRGIPEDRVRLHICWGSWNAPHTSDVPLKLIIDRVLQVKTQGYSLEGANDRHEHEVLMWDDVKLPEGKILLPGVVGHVSNVIEHPELVAWRLRLYAERVGKENVVASTDCGFSQGWSVRRVHPQVQAAKLRALVEGARLASAQLWGARSSEPVSALIRSER
jgi:5-methyltetrahydropteroyltriglutamate--homocysteine methyltransferase